LFVSKTLPAKLFQVVGTRAHPTLECFKYYPYLKSEREFLEQTDKIKIEYGTLQKLFNNYTEEQIITTDSQNPENEHFTVEIKNRYGFDVPTVKVRQDRRFCSVMQRFPNLPTPNDIQFDVSNALYEGKDIIAILPTGFGKTLIAGFSSVLRHLEEPEGGTTVTMIVVPLTILMGEHSKEMRKWGIAGCQLTSKTREEVIRDVTKCRNDPDPTCEKLFVLISTPEFLNTDVGKEAVTILQPSILFVDEAHLVKEWGDEFRPAFAKLCELRPLSPFNICALTATCTQTVLECIQSSLNLQNDAEIFAASPNRPNIFLETIPSRRRNKFLEENICGNLRKYGKHFPRTIIFVETYSELVAVKKKTMQILQGYAYQGENVPENCMLGTYCAEMTEASKKSKDGVMRLLIATVAYGIGVNNKDVRAVVHWSEQKDLSKYCKQICRAGRDGRLAVAVGFSGKSQPTECQRRKMLEAFTLSDRFVMDIPVTVEDNVICYGNCRNCSCMKCVCCSYCRNHCPCDKEPFLEYFMPTF